MEFIIEVGTKEQRQLIRQELEIINTIANEFSPPLDISQVIIPHDFQATVNRLSGSTDYRAVRGESSSSIITALAKIVPQEESTAIVISSENYRIENYDTIIRTFTYLHELFHVANRRDFPKLPKDTFSSAYNC